MNTSGLNRVFVYGTLKRGEPNHHWFGTKEGGHYKFLYHAVTVEKFPLIIATKYNIPFLLYSPGNGQHVRGEVYEVSDKVLENLDVLEDHPNYYIREEDMVESDTEEKARARVWVYFIKNFKPELLKFRTFDSYSSNGDHGLKYVTSEESTVDDLLSVHGDIAPAGCL